MKLAGNSWSPDGAVIREDSRKVVTREHRRRVTRTVTHDVKDGMIEGRVNGLDVDGPVWFAATAHGVYRSDDRGASWLATSLPAADYPYLDAQGSTVIAGQRNSLMVSSDGGKQWKPVPLPSPLTGVAAVAISGDSAVWVGGRQGVFFSKDEGNSWNQIENLPLGGVNSLSYDASLKRVLVTSGSSTMIFGLEDTGAPWKYWNAGWLVHQVLQQGDRLAAASLYDGVVMEPVAQAPTAQEASTLKTGGTAE